MKPFNLNPKAAPSLEGIVRWIRTAATDINAQFRLLTPNIVSTSTTLTTTRNSKVIATASTTITLNAAPADQETVKVKRVTAAGNVTVAGNGNDIDGSSTYLITTNYESATFVYFEDEGEWYTL